MPAPRTVVQQFTGKALHAPLAKAAEVMLSRVIQVIGMGVGRDIRRIYIYMYIICRDI